MCGIFTDMSAQSFGYLLDSLSSPGHRFLSDSAPRIVFPGRHDGVLVRVVLAYACRNWIQNRLAIKPPEERGRIAFILIFVDDSMDRANEEVVRLSHEAIGNIYNEGVLHWLHFDPVSSFAEYF